MGALAGSVARVRPAIDPTGRETVDRLALWLLMAIGLDLVLTRFLVRLAIFVPKGEPFATASAVLGRIGAATDALVPIMGILLLGALLVRAGSAGGRIDQTMLVAIAMVAAGGLALVAYPPTPLVVNTLGLLVGSLALLAGLRLGLDRGLLVTARVGLVALAVAVAAASIARATEGPVVSAGSAAGWPDGISGLTIGVIGQVAFVVGVGLVGLAGAFGNARALKSRRRLAATGIVAGMAALAAGTVSPVTWAALTTWSIGLTGVIPTPAVAIAVGLAVAGLPALHERAPHASVGAAIVLLAGYGLAASGLVLASLLGLVVAGIGGADRSASGESCPLGESQ